MSKKLKTILLVILFLILLIFLYNAFILFEIYSTGLDEFNGDYISIFGTIIQGMSGLLSVAIAVIIFRIQSLENRNFSLEQSTLNYIHNIIEWTYPKWCDAVEEHIRTQVIVQRYYDKMVRNRLRNTLSLSDAEQEKLVTEKENQQKRLEEVLAEHNKINQTIKRTRDGIISSVVLLISPILASFLMLMASDATDPLINFIVVVIVVLLSATGIVMLVKTVLDSTVQDT